MPSEGAAALEAAGRKPGNLSDLLGRSDKKAAFAGIRAWRAKMGGSYYEAYCATCRYVAFSVDHQHTRSPRGLH